MANERDDEQFGKEDKELSQNKQQPTGQQGQNPAVSQGQSPSGQADLGTGADTTTLSGERLGSGSIGGTPSSQSPGGTGNSQGGFVGSQGSGSDDYLQEGSTDGSDFASQGQGALEDEDIETGQKNTRDNDIEGGSGNI